MQGEVMAEFTDSQLYKIGTVYDFIARLLPVEGRDYNVIFSFDDKYYGFEYSWSPYCGTTFDDDNDLPEYEPYEKTVIDYKFKQ
jgi:hypothetical protein